MHPSFFGYRQFSNIMTEVDLQFFGVISQGAFHALRPEDLRRGKEIFLAQWRENLMETIENYCN